MWAVVDVVLGCRESAEKRGTAVDRPQQRRDEKQERRALQQRQQGLPPFFAVIRFGRPFLASKGQRRDSTSDFDCLMLPLPSPSRHGIATVGMGAAVFSQASLIYFWMVFSLVRFAPAVVWEQSRPGQSPTAHCPLPSSKQPATNRRTQSQTPKRAQPPFARETTVSSHCTGSAGLLHNMGSPGEERRSRATIDLTRRRWDLDSGWRAARALTRSEYCP